MRTIAFLKRFCVLVVLAAMTIMANANPVDLATARQVGAKFLHASALLRSDDPANLQLVKTYRTANNDAAFYVFNTTDGFVIVSADDCATPILGYSNESVFTVDDVPIQMEDYLQQFVKQIQYGIDNHLVDNATAHQWELVRATGLINEERGTSAVAPLLTDIWGQGCYYNDKCPSDANGPCGHALTGCVATSFAQILHYWGYPATGTGSHSYTPEGYPLQSVNFGATTYQWANMPNSLAASSSTTQVDAVSTLMWHCGVAVEMDYGVSGSSASSADIVPALVNYFGYSTDATIISRGNYSLSQWLTLIKNCLDLGRPVHYRGTNENGGGGHAFVCDGYDNNDYLHFNWGWNGSGNNYFADGALNPNSSSAYNINNRAIINIHPLLPSYQVTISSNPSNGGTVSFGAKGDRETTIYGFEDGMPAGWNVIDDNNDGYSWCMTSDVPSTWTYYANMTLDWYRSGSNAICSGSYINGVGALTPDEYLVTNQLSLTNGSSFSFWAAATDASYPADHFGVFVSDNGTSNWTSIQEWTLIAKDNEFNGGRASRDGNGAKLGNWYQYSVDLSAYAGQQKYIAIRHFNCTDQYIMCVDDIAITTGGGGSGNSSSAYFDQGQTCVVTANPNSGYYFANWTENGTVVSASANYSFTVNGARNLVANFTTQPQPQQYTVTISANPANGGSVAFGNKGDRETTIYGFEEGMPAGWNVIDANNDGYTWCMTSDVPSTWTYYANMTLDWYRSGSNAICSGSFINGVGVLTPDEYLVTNQLSLTNGSSFSFWAAATDASYPADHFGVFISDNGTSNWTSIQEWTLVAKNSEFNGGRASRDGNGAKLGNWYEYSVDLSAYAGQQKYIAIRHFNCTDQYIMCVDDITLTTGGGGGGGNPSSAVYTQGQSCTVTATANSGYTFSNWTENGTVVSTNANYTFTVNGNRTLVANFTTQPQPQQYTVTISANPTNGGSVAFGNKGDRETITYDFENGTMMNWTSLDADGDGYDWVSSTEPGQYHNSGVNLAGTGHNASQAYVISGSYSNSASMALTPDNYLISPSKAAYSQIGFYACAQDANYAADHFGVAVSTTGNTSASSFTTIQEWTMTAKGSGMESMGRDGDSKDQGVWYNYSVDLSAYAGQDIWVAIRHFNCTDEFILNVDDITLTTGGGGGNPSSAVYTQGQSCTVTATANSGYYFSNWTENGTVVSTNANYTFTVNGNRTLVANFTASQPQQYTVSVSANPSNGGTVTGGGTYLQGTTCLLTATPNNGFVFSNWTQNGTVVSSNPSFNITVSGNVAYVAHFTVQSNNFTITASADPVEGGVVSGGGTYDQGAVCSLSATANTGYQFVNWTKNGTPVSSNPSFSFNVTENASYVAHFSLLTFTISVSANPVEGGLVTGGGVYGYGETVTVSVTPNDQYLFLNWTENWAVVSEEQTFSFIATSDKVLVAQLSFVDDVQEIDAKEVRAYPNPAHDKLYVECGQHIIGCELFAADGTWMGKVEPEAMKAEISLHNLPSGMYLVKITTKDQVLMTRFVKE